MVRDMGRVQPCDLSTPKKKLEKLPNETKKEENKLVAVSEWKGEEERRKITKCTL